MKKILLALSLCFLMNPIFAIKYDLNEDDTITNLADPKFSGYIQQSTHTPVGSPPAGKGWIYEKTDKKLYFKNEDGIEYELTIGAGASTLEVKEDGVQVSSPTASLDFGPYFNITESPSFEANILLDTTTLLGSYWQTIGWEQYFSYISPEIQVSTNQYIIGYSSATTFYGDGSNLTGITGVTDHLLLTSTGTNTHAIVDTHLGLTNEHIDWIASSVGTIDPTNYTDTNTQNESAYNIIIATYAGTGITYNAHVVSSFTAQIGFQQAFDAASVGDTIYVKGGTYVFSGSCTIMTSNISLVTDSAVLTPDVNYYDSNNLTQSVILATDGLASDVKIRGFFFDGNHQQVTGLYIRGDNYKIYDIGFKNCDGGSATRAFYNHADGDNGSIVNMIITDCDGGKPIDILGKDIRINNLFIKDCANLSSFEGTQIIINGFSHFNSGQIGLAANSVITNFVSANTTVNIWGFVIVGVNCVISNGVFSASAFKHALWLNNSDGTVVTNITFKNIGTSVSNVANAIALDASQCAISNIRFTGIIDKYCIEIKAGEKDNIISNCNAVGITGQTGYILDNNDPSTNQVSNSIPAIMNYDILVASQTAGGYPDIGTPIRVGTRVTTSASYERWISTGTSNDKDWQKIGAQ